MRTALVLAAGGERVVAWEAGVLAGLADAGVDLRGADRVLGTSAGAAVGARLAAGVDPRRDADRLAVTAAPQAPVPAPGGGGALFARLAELWTGPGGEGRRELGRLALEHPAGDPEAFVERVGRRLAGGAWPPALRTVAIDALSGERVALGPRPGLDLAHAVAASRAVPLLCPPVPIGGRPHIDGAMGSATNADLLAAEEPGRALVVTATPEAPKEPGAGPLWQQALRDELDVLRDAGWQVAVVQAGPADVEAMGPDPTGSATAHLAVAAGRRRGREAVAFSGRA